MAHAVQQAVPMQPSIDVVFHRRARSPSLASTVHRWVARFEAMHLDVARAAVEIETGDRRTTVALALTLSDGKSSSVATSHADPYVAVSDAFRAARRELLPRE